MSVRGGGGWENLELQHLHDIFHVTADDFDGTGNFYLAEPATSYLPAGGLDRNEVAELVWARFNAFAFGEPDNTLASPGNVDCKYELSFAPNSIILDAPSGSPERIETTPDGVTNTDAIRHDDHVDSASQDVIWYVEPHNFFPTHDDVAGVGAGGTQHMAHEHVGFREALGGGPEADSHDNLYAHVQVGGHNNTNGHAYLYVNVQMAWDIRQD